MREEKVSIELSAHEMATNGPGWVRQQMEQAGMRAYPYHFRSKDIGTVTIEGVKQNATEFQAEKMAQ